MKKFLTLLGAIGFVIFSAYLSGRLFRGNTIFAQLGIYEKDVKKITLCFEDEKRLPVKLTLKEENRWYEELREYLNAPIEVCEIPVEMYRVDPVSAIVETERGREKLYFISTEGSGEPDTTVYWYWKGKTYRLLHEDVFLQYQIEPALEKRFKTRDPLTMFFQHMLGYASEADKSGDSHWWAFPLCRYMQQEWDLPSLEELIRKSEDIFCATIVGQEVLDERKYAMAGYSIEQMEKHPEHGDWFLYGDWEVRVEDCLRGEVRKNEILTVRAPYAEFAYSYKKPEQTWNLLGITQRSLVPGKTYIFFTKELKCEEDVPYWTADRYLGIMEITEDHRLQPIFNPDVQLLDEYCIALEELTERVQLAEGRAKDDSNSKNR